MAKQSSWLLPSYQTATTLTLKLPSNHRLLTCKMTGLCTPTLFIRPACNEFLLGHSPFITLFKQHDLQRPIEMTPQDSVQLGLQLDCKQKVHEILTPSIDQLKQSSSGLQPPCSHEPNSQNTLVFTSDASCPAPADGRQFGLDFWISMKFLDILGSDPSVFGTQRMSWLVGLVGPSTFVADAYRPLLHQILTDCTVQVFAALRRCCQPWMLQRLSGCHALHWVYRQQSIDEILCQWRNILPVLNKQHTIKVNNCLCICTEPVNISNQRIIWLSHKHDHTKSGHFY